MFRLLCFTLILVFISGLRLKTPAVRNCRLKEHHWESTLLPDLGVFRNATWGGDDAQEHPKPMRNGYL